MSAIGIVLLGLEFAHNFCVGDFLETIGWDVLVLDGEEGVGAFDARACVGGIGPDTLTQAAYFIVVRFVPCELVLWMAAELAIFERLASFEVQDRHIPVVKECGWVLATGSRGWSNDVGSLDMRTGMGRYRRQHRMAVTGACSEGNGIRYVRGWVGWRSQGY